MTLENSNKQLALWEATQEMLVTQMEPSTSSSIFDLPEHVKAEYQDTEMYRSLENAELDYAIRLAKTQCTRCTQDRAGEVICCKEKCSMFEAKIQAYEKGFSGYSACYNCPRYNVDCLGIESGVCCVEGSTIPLEVMKGVIDDDMFELLEGLDMSDVDKGLFRTIKRTLEYFDKKKYKRTDLIFCTYFLNHVAELLLTEYSSPQEDDIQISKLPIGYKVVWKDTVIYATDDTVMVDGKLPLEKVIDILDGIPGYSVPAQVERL